MYIKTNMEGSLNHAPNDCTQNNLSFEFAIPTHSFLTAYQQTKKSVIQTTRPLRIMYNFSVKWMSIRLDTFATVNYTCVT